ncbi:hypothetical protein [Butyricicoccus sp. OM04-18BH]|jgi:hypothetical protein|uniref:hypothetical protein n=1 Tax=Agathobaculum sp. TaxID=2048138 RepID=UPI0011C2161A
MESPSFLTILRIQRIAADDFPSVAFTFYQLKALRSRAAAAFFENFLRSQSCSTRELRQIVNKL